MTRQPGPETTDDWDKPRYDPPQVVDLSKMAHACGVDDCAIGSGVFGPCATGIRAGFGCKVGTSPNQRD